MEEYRRCNNCLYKYRDANKEPCKSCNHIYKDGWEPDGHDAELRAQMEEKAKAQAAESQEENMVNRKIPLPNVSPIFEHEASDYPDAVRVSFPNGRTIVYTRQVQQPEPMLVESIRIIRKWKTEGYQYTPPRRRRNQK